MGVVPEIVLTSEDKTAKTKLVRSKRPRGVMSQVRLFLR